MRKPENETYYTIKGWKRHLKATQRKKQRKIQRAGQLRHQLHIKYSALKKGVDYKVTLKGKDYSIRRQEPMPELSDTMKYLANIPHAFSKQLLSSKSNLKLPECFSLIENYEESFVFLKQLFITLYRGEVREVILDYEQCKRIDVDASICMDIILQDFIKHLHSSWKRGYHIFPHNITPRNFKKKEIQQVLYSIGAFRNIQGVSREFKGIHGLPTLVNNYTDPNVYHITEQHLTRIVDYIKTCLGKMQRQLTPEAENELYTVIGEVTINAEEHGTVPRRFAIGMFEESNMDGADEEHFGTFNFSILNFGKTIYETFKTDSCQNHKAIKEMQALSSEYTKKGWFRKAKFEEETLWTLYALQEGITSTGTRRGNGSIQYIENFFKLKGDMQFDSISKLVVISGNSRIEFDGTYQIVKKPVNGYKKPFKLMTFNEKGDISELPDEKYVTFAPHYFPGTIISARILIKHKNIK